MTSVRNELTGRCYCGAVRFRAATQPLTTAYCHCNDCRRVSGAPVSAFACFAPSAVTWTPGIGSGVSHAPGVRRWYCTSCGSPLAATYDYLPDQVYVPVGLFDDIDALAPAGHSHFGSRVSWLHLEDDLPRSDGSGRERLNRAAP